MLVDTRRVPGGTALEAGCACGAGVRHRRLVTILESEPNPDSRVTLSRERDALGLPRPKVDWRLTALAERSFVRSRQILAAEFAHRGLGTLELDVDDGFPDELHWCWHHHAPAAD